MAETAEKKASTTKNIVERVISDMQLCGLTKYVPALEIAPDVANYCQESVTAAAQVAVDQREAEAKLAKVVSENGVSLERVRRGEAQDFYGPTLANPVIDALAVVNHGRTRLKQAIKGAEADIKGALSKPEVKAQLSEFAVTIASSQEELDARQESVNDAARTLRSIITQSDDLKNLERSSGVGNLFNVRTGDMVTSGDLVTRHRQLAKALSGDAV